MQLIRELVHKPQVEAGRWNTRRIHIGSTDIEMLSRFKQRTRAVLRRCWIGLLFCTGLLWFAKWRLGLRGAIIVLALHRVLTDSENAKTNSSAGMVVREQTFETLARYVVRRYRTVNLVDGESEWAANDSRPRLAFTFDDGWGDNASTAFPIASQHGIPVTIFICPERVGFKFPYWPERVAALWQAAKLQGVTHKLEGLLANRGLDGTLRTRREDNGEAVESVIEQLKTFPAEQRNQAMNRMAEVAGGEPNSNGSRDITMTWEEIEALENRGVTFGSHTLSHVILTRVPLSEAEREISDSKHALDRRLQRECRLLAYPNGNWSTEVRGLAAQAGYKLAFTNTSGAWTRQSDPLLIPRVNLWEGNVVGPSGRFSRIAFEYTAFWKTLWAKDTLSVGRQSTRFASESRYQGTRQ